MEWNGNRFRPNRSVNVTEDCSKNYSIVKFGIKAATVTVYRTVLEFRKKEKINKTNLSKFVAKYFNLFYCRSRCPYLYLMSALV